MSLPDYLLDEPEPEPIVCEACGVSDEDAEMTECSHTNLQGRLIVYYLCAGCAKGETDDD